MFKNFIKAISDWYKGKYIPWENDYNSNVIFTGHDHNLHWTAKTFKALVSFFMKHWKWIISTIILIFFSSLTLYLKYSYEPKSLENIKADVDTTKVIHSSQ